MFQLYATGSATPITNATMTYFVTTDVVPSLQLFLAGQLAGVLMSFLFIMLLLLLTRVFDQKY